MVQIDKEARNLSITRPDNNNVILATPCMICGEGVSLSEYEECAVKFGRPIPSKICDDCKKAILAVKKIRVANRCNLRLIDVLEDTESISIDI